MKLVHVFLIAFLGALLGGGCVYYGLTYVKSSLDLSVRDTGEMAFVNLTKIKNEGLAFKSLNTLVAEESKKFQQEISEIESTVLKEYDAIKRLKKDPKTPQAKLRHMRDELDAKVRDIEKKILEKKEDLHGKFSKLSELLEEKLKEIIQKIYDENNFDVIFNATILDFPIVLNSKDYLDISDDVLERLNQDLPKLSL